MRTIIINAIYVFNSFSLILIEHLNSQNKVHKNQPDKQIKNKLCFFKIISLLSKNGINQH
ncbi:hypothetical protein XIS1_1280020 [Xenorhabdus innexi]|uniref:Uncharacterized protein n=1 Tax=Xenorhabdus innexi TaxID=290109 RepID=A0A1N6MST9_9GAMM|nr:hypothetical protein XIS1_1280020 [Xenorhabdus innexi]